MLKTKVNSLWKPRALKTISGGKDTTLGRLYGYLIYITKYHQISHTQSLVYQQVMVIWKDLNIKFPSFWFYLKCCLPSLHVLFLADFSKDSARNQQATAGEQQGTSKECHHVIRWFRLSLLCLTTNPSWRVNNLRLFFVDSRVLFRLFLVYSKQSRSFWFASVHWHLFFTGNECPQWTIGTAILSYLHTNGNTK